MEKEEYIKEQKERIKEALKGRGVFSHNLISAILRNVKSTYGADEANKVVADMDLEAIVGIQPITLKKK